VLNTASFFDAQKAFLDENRVIAEDLEHRNQEKNVIIVLEKLKAP
jgi:hypothetical protein